jgi:hypothetical protein
MRGLGESASYGVFVACEAAKCDRYVKAGCAQASPVGGVALMLACPGLGSVMVSR